MAIYWLLLLIPGALCLLLQPWEAIYRGRVVLVTFFLILAMLLALRGVGCGVDLENYQYYFLHIAAVDWKDLGSFGLELGFAVYVKLVSLLTDSFQIFLAVTAVLSLLPLMILYCRNPEYPFLQILLFVNLSIFPRLFSGIRQSFAIAIGVLAFDAVRKRKPCLFICLVLAASWFHSSAPVLGLMYPVFFLKLRKRYLPVIVGALVALFVLKERMFLLLSELGQLLEIKYAMKMTDTGTYAAIVLYTLFCLFSMIVAEEQGDETLCGLRNLMLLALVIQVFAPLHHTVSRVGFYFLVFIPTMMGRTLCRAISAFSDLVRATLAVICLFFFGYFLYTGYLGEDILCIYPYIPFWKGV